MSKSISPDTIIGPYRVVTQIGEGGMGEVYLAEDSRLHRKVALKILPSEMAANQDRMRRFQQEAMAAAALNHPNIAHIYEIGEHDGTNFIAMEFVDGVTLRHKIHRERAELKKLLRYLQHVAEGLAKAHSAGIVHRDLKPDNIMITHDGHAKVLDFGLAKLIEPQQPPGMNNASTGEDATAILQQQSTPGLIMGTVGYMSPEQAQGKTNEIDQRSDIFSFGCILFEAITGHKAFAGKDAVDSLNKIIREPEAPLSHFRPDAPNHLQRIVRRCLAKDPEDRYQTIKDVAIELRNLRHELAAGETGTSEVASQSAAGSTSGSRVLMSSRASSAEYFVSGLRQHKLAVVIALLVLVAGAAGLGLFLRARSAQVAIQSIAVLPFQNRSSDANTDYLTDGLAESLIFSLSQLPNLKVSPTSSVFRYKGRETDPQIIAKELGVDAVMTGRLVQRGDNLTISVELVDVRHNKVLWGEQIERKMSELLATQREIAAEITNKLQLKLSGEGEQKLKKKYTSSNEAFQLYLKGRFYWAKRTKDDLLKAVDYYKQAIALDSNFALAYVGIATAYNSMGKDPDISPREAIPRAKAAATLALEIDPGLAEAHAALADSLAIFDWNWAESERGFKRAIELDPNVSYIHVSYAGSYLTAMGRANEVVAETERAMELEPLALINNTLLVTGSLYARQNDKALQQARKAYDLDPNFPLAQLWLSLAYIANGKYDDAIDLGEEGLQKSPSKPAFLYVIAQAYAKSGRQVEAQQFIETLREAAKTQYVRTYYIACIYAALGDKDRAFAELEQSFEDKDCFLPRMKIDPLMDPLREDPRFRDLLKRLNLPE